MYSQTKLWPQLNSCVRKYTMIYANCWNLNARTSRERCGSSCGNRTRLGRRTLVLLLLLAYHRSCNDFIIVRRGLKQSFVANKCDGVYNIIIDLNGLLCVFSFLSLYEPNVLHIMQWSFLFSRTSTLLASSTSVVKNEENNTSYCLINTACPQPNMPPHYSELLIVKILMMLL